MIIWDDSKNNPKHNIRINGKHILDIKASYIQYSNLDMENLQQEIKNDADPKLAAEGYHIYAHIFTKNPPEYALWLGPINTEPISPPGYEWWEGVP